ncbi:MAG: recombination protein RecR [Candidatus Magasanikbacteria bacterium RIFOXYA2_FULL_44_8]|uniref:Recombination protein RecR n=1 Tax=Candidatus Magasanikbacteria bacterium RIFOXYA2_FULL_44_8 TaxID=1798696 RepID=A0A1F6NIU9_9BACT|nr:MAG: recombination protein RecR [Candidatus Magasanikbacteria bacterium RIFOXYA2_FULL_44_8]
MYSRSITNLIQALKKLPSVGERTAERYVFHLLKKGKGEVNDLRSALDELLTNTKSCEVCWNFSDSTPCNICRDTKRDHTTVCVVADPQDVPAIEKTGAHAGAYHVLRGVLETADEENFARIKIRELLKRIHPTAKTKIYEIILALNPDLPGETTAMYLEKNIVKINPKIKVTRLARGLPMGSDLQYADEITLASALKNRK